MCIIVVFFAYIVFLFLFIVEFLIFYRFCFLQLFITLLKINLALKLDVFYNV